MKISLLLGALATSVLLIGCGKQEAPKSQAAAQPVAVTRIVVGLDDNFPPMGFRDKENKLVGFDIDLAREAARRLGAEVEFKPIDWNAKEAELNSKRVDALWNGLTITEQRKEKIAFTTPYLENRQIVVVTAKSPVKSKADLAGKIVGLQEGSSAVEAVEKDGVAKSIKEVRKYGDNVTALMDLSTGRLDALVVDEVVGRYYLAKKPGEYLVLEDHFGTEEYGVGVRKDDTELLGKLQKTMDEMKKDGAAARISSEWFGRTSSSNSVSCRSGRHSPARNGRGFSRCLYAARDSAQAALRCCFPPVPRLSADQADSMDYIIQILGPLLAGTAVTLQVFLLTLLLSVPLGLVLALLRVSHFRLASSIVNGYIWLMRGTPLMLQMLFIYFALPFVPVIGVRLPDFPAAIVAFVLNYAAYFAEIFRAGIQSIERGQYEAARVLGLTYGQTMRRIVLPQVVKRILPPMSNETITLVKDTSLIYVLAMNDLLRAARGIVQRDFTTMPFVVAAAFYLLMTLALTWGFNYLEKRHAVYDE